MKNLKLRKQEEAKVREILSHYDTLLLSVKRDIFTTCDNMNIFNTLVFEAMKGHLVFNSVYVPYECGEYIEFTHYVEVDSVLSYNIKIRIVFHQLFGSDIVYLDDFCTLINRETGLEYRYYWR